MLLLYIAIGVGLLCLAGLGAYLWLLWRVCSRKDPAKRYMPF